MTTLTDKIFELSAPYDNPYQGNTKKLLFVCSAGLLRSATAATIYTQKGYNTRSCGTEDYALIPLSTNLIHWADTIFFVNLYNYNSAISKFVDDDLVMIQDKSVVLGITDNYEYMNPELIKILEEQIGSI